MVRAQRISRQRKGLGVMAQQKVASSRIPEALGRDPSCQKWPKSVTEFGLGLDMGLLRSSSIYQTISLQCPMVQLLPPLAASAPRASSPLSL